MIVAINWGDHKMTDNITTATQNGVNVTPTYIVRRNGRKLPNKVFATYEKARQWVRKKVRISESFELLFDDSFNRHRTPELGRHGYSISKVEG
jgi:hypothetical protein